MTLAIDHVLFAVDDLAAAAREIEKRFGLASIEGGRHPAWGTANRIVPLGASYLELVTVVDPDVAAASAFGRWVAAGRSGRPLGWAVRTDTLDAIARRLGLSIASGSRETPAGEVIRWRSTGLAEAAVDPSLPFFIEWADGSPFPGSAPVDHPGRGANLRRVSLAGDADRIASWLGEAELPVRIDEGPSGIVRVVLSRGSREFSVDW